MGVSSKPPSDPSRLRVKEGGYSSVESVADIAEARETRIRIAVMQHKCPICKTPTDSALHPEFPFCSERCQLRDLGNWAAEKYVVSEPIFNEDDEELNESPNADDTQH